MIFTPLYKVKLEIEPNPGKKTEVIRRAFLGFPLP